MKNVQKLINHFENEASKVQRLDRALSPKEVQKLKAIYRSLPLLQQVAALFPSNKRATNNLITYKIVSDLDGRLKTGARTACNFWNRFVHPANSIVIRLGTFYSPGSTIARAYHPNFRNEIKYGRVEFNTKYLADFSSKEIAGTIVHEIGHTLGIGFADWHALFSKTTGLFNPSAIDQLPALQNMHVETDYGRGTQYSHWDEQRYGRELMTGLQEREWGQYVMPVTIDVLELFGHDVIEHLTAKEDLDVLLDDAAEVQFTRKEQAKALDLDYFEETEVFEEIPHR